MPENEYSEIAYITPILQSEQLSKICGNQIFLKSEHLQKTGSFKIRGASNKVIHAIENGAKYVTTASSGNHGQAVAYVANKYGVPATIVVPENASHVRSMQSRLTMARWKSAAQLPESDYQGRRQLLTNENGIYIPPYDDPFIMAGQGTIGLEILEQVENVDAIIVPIGGGGLLSGISDCIKETNPKIKVIGVEPELANDTYLSLHKQENHHNYYQYTLRMD